MRMKTLKRLICCVVLCGLLLTSLGGVLYTYGDTEEETDSSEQINYVLVLDCTRKAAEADDEYNIRKAAAKLFVDLLPVENANISILTIGEKSPQFKDSYHLQADEGHIYTGNGITKYTNENNAAFRMQCIYQIVPMGTASTREVRDEIKRKIDQAYTLSPSSTFSDIHCGLYAAMDVLKASGTGDGKGCVFLISDNWAMAYQGHMIQRADGKVIDLDNDYKEANGEDGIYHTMFDDVRECAQAHNWPVNWINLQRGGESNKDGRSIRADMERICNSTTSKGSIYPKDANTYLNIADLPRELTQLFASNATRLGGNQSAGMDTEPVELKLDASGMAEINVAEQGLLSEINLVLTGDQVNYIEVIDEKNESIKIKNKDNSNSVLWYSVETDPASNAFLYSHLKAIVPTASNLNRIRVHGNANTTVYCQIVKACDPTFVLETSQAPGTYSKNQAINFTGKFRYLDLDISNPTFYKNYNAQLIVLNMDTGAEEVIECSSNDSGTAYQCTFRPVHEGRYTFYLQVKNNAFDTGICKTASVNFNFANGIPETVGTIPDMELYVGQEGERIELSQYFTDTDGDALTYSFTSVNDLTLYNNVPVDSEFSYWVFPAQEKEGDMEIRVLAADPDGSTVAQTFHVRIVNREPQLVQSISDFDLVLSNGIFAGLLKESDLTEETLNLSQFFTDPDGFDLSFSCKVEDISKDDEEMSVLETELDANSGVVHIVPQSAGKSHVTFIATDNNGAKISCVVEVRVKKVTEVLLARHWPILALAAFVLFVIVVMISSKRVHGSWTIEIKDNNTGNRCRMDASRLTGKNVKGAKVDMKELALYVMNKVNVVLSTENVDSECVILKGTIFPTGKCGVQIRRGANVAVILNGANCTKPNFTLKAGDKLQVTYNGRLEINVSFT